MSSLNALYSAHPHVRGTLQDRANVHHRIIAELRSFLRLCRATGKIALLDEMEAFTRSFDSSELDLRDFSIARLLDELSLSVLKSREELEEDPVMLAFTPNAIVAYLEMMCGFSTVAVSSVPLAISSFPSSSVFGRECILGWGRGGGRHNGLRHWSYQQDGVLYKTAFSMKTGSLAN